MPLEGPFYIIYLRPHWWPIAAPARDQESSIGHPELWRNAVVPMLAKHYGIKSAARKNRLADACYGVPRGRVCRTGDSYTVWHGENWGKDINAKWIRKCIVREFELGTVANLQWAYDEHYGILEEDRSVLERMRLLPRPGWYGD